MKIEIEKNENSSTSSIKTALLNFIHFFIITIA